MRIYKLLAWPILATTAACSGLGANDTLIVDGPKSAHFETDLSACRNLARNQSHMNAETGAAAVLGATVGALAGLVDDDTTPAEGAIGGALGGAVMATVTNAEKRQQIVFNCMQGRGHRVVG